MDVDNRPGIPARVHLISSSPKAFLILDDLSFPFTSEPLAIPTATARVPRSAARNLSTVRDPIGSSQLASVPAHCPARGIPARAHLISSSPKAFLILDDLSFPFTSEPLVIPTATARVPRSAARNLSTVCDPIGSSQLASVPAHCPARGSLLVVRFLQSTNLRSSDLRTSVSWLNDKVKGIKKLRLNQDEGKGSLRELGELAHSAGNSWWPAQLSSVECYGPGRCGRVMGGYGLVGS
ncbi:hypothetical protein F2Q69_00045943 [Brassica cretica]|uniref:Uncharacterized protein n=1 Tax=Brassica cretica TaxID=69181 RepID=A0A8S9PTA8_BRACR|nr:hypothetical protein F2Q69_00045943 [Brassica cretica]